MSEDDRRVLFGNYILHPAARSLTVQGHSVVLGSRALDLLIALIDRRGELVSKKTLLELVWPGVTIEEGNLRVVIRALRRALEDDGKTYIVNVPGRGYTFVVPASNPPSRIGILHSLSGPLALSEGTIVDATLLAVHQINARGGIRGREIE